MAGTFKQVNGLKQDGQKAPLQLRAGKPREWFEKLMREEPKPERKGRSKPEIKLGKINEREMREFTEAAEKADVNVAMKILQIVRETEMHKGNEEWCAGLFVMLFEHSSMEVARSALDLAVETSPEFMGMLYKQFSGKPFNGKVADADLLRLEFAKKRLNTCDAHYRNDGEVLAEVMRVLAHGKCDFELLKKAIEIKRRKALTYGGRLDADAIAPVCIVPIIAIWIGGTITLCVLNGASIVGGAIITTISSAVGIPAAIVGGLIIGKVAEAAGDFLTKAARWIGAGCYAASAAAAYLCNKNKLRKSLAGNERVEVG